MFYSLVYQSETVKRIAREIITGSSGPVVRRALLDRGVPGSILARGTANFFEQEINPTSLQPGVNGNLRGRYNSTAAK